MELMHIFNIGVFVLFGLCIMYREKYPILEKLLIGLFVLWLGLGMFGVIPFDVDDGFCESNPHLHC